MIEIHEEDAGFCSVVLGELREFVFETTDGRWDILSQKKGDAYESRDSAIAAATELLWERAISPKWEDKGRGEWGLYAAGLYTMIRTLADGTTDWFNPATGQTISNHADSREAQFAAQEWLKAELQKALEELP